MKNLIVTLLLFYSSAASAQIDTLHLTSPIGIVCAVVHGPEEVCSWQTQPKSGRPILSALESPATGPTLFKCSWKDKTSTFFSVPGYRISGRNFIMARKFFGKKYFKPLPKRWYVWEIRSL